MDGGQQSKQQIVDRLKSTTNILITVSTNPSVDELSAALSLTLLLNKMKKQATAVFSGIMPPAIQFLEPQKTFEGTVDSLRDFIVALDKQKAGRIKYKVDGNMVRIFITPYRTVITQKDLEFSQGDFNVETIVALGVERREEIDKAITAHGRILHDATVITISAKSENNNLGSLDWQESSASSLCEMLMSLTELLEPDILDSQIATALLTGIVSATGRFSNQKTSPQVMTMAAQLMAAGANQQLIASKLQERPKTDGNQPSGNRNNQRPISQDGKDSDDGAVILNPRADISDDAQSKSQTSGSASSKNTANNSGNNQGKSKQQNQSQGNANSQNNTQNASKADAKNTPPSTQPPQLARAEEEPVKLPLASLNQETTAPKKKAAGEIEISHEDKTVSAASSTAQGMVGTLPAAFQAVATASDNTKDYALNPDQYAERREKAAIAEAEQELANALPQATALSSQVPALEDLHQELQAEPPTMPSVTPDTDSQSPSNTTPSPKVEAGSPTLSPAKAKQAAAQPSWMDREISEPSLGGSLSATTRQAAEDKQHEEDESGRRNHTILNHTGDGHDSRPVSPVSLPAPNPVAPADFTMPAPPPEPALAPIPEPAPQPMAAPVSMPAPVEPDPTTMLPPVPVESYDQNPADPLPTYQPPQAAATSQPYPAPQVFDAPALPAYEPAPPMPIESAPPAAPDLGNLDAAREAVEAALSAPSMSTDYEATPLPPAPQTPSLPPLEAALDSVAPTYDTGLTPPLPPIPNAPSAMPPLPPAFNSPLPVAPDIGVSPSLPTDMLTPNVAYPGGMPNEPAAIAPSAPPSPSQFRIPGQ